MIITHVRRVNICEYDRRLAFLLLASLFVHMRKMVDGVFGDSSGEKVDQGRDVVSCLC
jgi:hypothetical protein